jgi:hypothetical protein
MVIWNIKQLPWSDPEYGIPGIRQLYFFPGININSFFSSLAEV